MSRLIPVNRTIKAERRLAFLVRSAQNAFDLSRRFRPELSETDEEPSKAAYDATDREAALAKSGLFFDCAELAFCTNKTNRGLGFLREAHSVLSSVEAGPDSVPWRAISSAILLEEKLILEGDQIYIGSEKMPWAALGPRAVIVAVLPLLTLAACARGRWLKTAPYLYSAGNDDLVLFESRAAAFSQTEFSFLRLCKLSLSQSMVYFEEDDNSKSVSEAVALISVLEASYDRKIALIISDKFRWQDLRARAGLIDWPLLLYYLMMLRWVPDQFTALSETKSEPINFLRSIAEEIQNAVE